MRPRPDGSDRRSRRRRVTAGLRARPVERHHGERHAGKLLPRVGLASADDRRHVTPAGALNLERRAAGDEARLVAQRADAALHQVRAEVVEQQEPAEQEEHDDQDGGNEADENVRQDELPPDAPQQTPFRSDEQPDDEVDGADRKRRHRVRHREKHRERRDRPDDENHQPDRDADDDQAPRQRVPQRVDQPRLLIECGREERPSGARASHVRGLRDISRSILANS